MSNDEAQVEREKDRFGFSFELKKLQCFHLFLLDCSFIVHIVIIFLDGVRFFFCYGSVKIMRWGHVAAHLYSR